MSFRFGHSHNNDKVEAVMADLYLSAERQDGTKLVLSPLSTVTANRSETQPCDLSGYFLYETQCNSPHAEICILARIEDDEAALRVGDIFGLR